MMRLIISYIFISGMLLVMSPIAHAATWTIHYSKPEDPTDPRTTYPLAVLKLALEHTGVNYQLYPSKKVLSQGRSIKQLKASREVSIIWSMTDEIREEEAKQAAVVQI